MTRVPAKPIRIAKKAVGSQATSTAGQHTTLHTAPPQERSLRSDDRPWARRHPLIVTLISIMVAPFLLAMLLGMIKGLISINPSSPTPISTVKTITEDYQDCLSLASADGFAPEVCEGLNPQGSTARTNCNFEVAHSLPEIDCTTTTRPTPGMTIKP